MSVGSTSPWISIQSKKREMCMTVCSAVSSRCPASTRMIQQTTMPSMVASGYTIMRQEKHSVSREGGANDSGSCMAAQCDTCASRSTMVRVKAHQHYIYLGLVLTVPMHLDTNNAAALSSDDHTVFFEPRDVEARVALLGPMLGLWLLRQAALPFCRCPVLGCRARPRPSQTQVYQMPENASTCRSSAAQAVVAHKYTCGGYLGCARETGLGFRV